MCWAARSVIPTLVATSRSRTAGSRTMQRSTWVWLVTNFQVPRGASLDISVLSVVYFVSCFCCREQRIPRRGSYVSTGQDHDISAEVSNMALSEIVLDSGDRQEVRVTDQPLAVGDMLELQGSFWEVVRELTRVNRAHARLQCQ